MDTKARTYPEVERRAPARTSQPIDYGWTLYMIVITLAMIAGYLVSMDRLYAPGDKIGYNLGLAGGIMMLTLLIYPVRKRVRFMRNWGLLPKWFKWHMVFGILGPAFIMFHSTFTIKSINAGVALVCMMLVSGSGIFGRFFYTKIHFGLYGRQATLGQLQSFLEGGNQITSIFSFAPDIERKMVKFRDGALKSIEGRKLARPWDFVKVGVQAPMLGRTLVRELEDAMYSDAQQKKWSKVQLKLLDELFEQNKAFIESYMETVKNIVQFGTYEKLFSMWHIFHVPLVYLLTFSAIWHVIAVHMY